MKSKYMATLIVKLRVNLYVDIKPLPTFYFNFLSKLHFEKRK